MIKYYSQNTNNFLIDQFIVNKFVSNKKIIDGTFLEVGGFDGVTYSNTKTLEDYFNFKGILVEPSPTSFSKLKQNRPNTKNYNLALDLSKGSVQFIGDDSAVAGIDKYMKEDKKNCWKRGGKGNLPIDGSTYEVKTDTLGNIINTSGFKYIDFCFIDVEGGELNVIKGMNWDIPIFMFIIEMTGSSSIPDYIEQIQAILKNKGYRLIHKAGYNDEFWMNPNYFRSHMFLNN